MKAILSVIIMLLVVAHAHAVDEATDIKNEAFDNVSSEFITCAGYFALVSRALENAGKTDLARKYDKAMNTAMDYALTTAEEGRTKEMAQKVTLARFEIDTQNMSKEIGSNASNISILTNKYGDRCKDIIEKPELVIQEWGNKAIERRKHVIHKPKEKR
jgi:hypothetical protein